MAFSFHSKHLARLCKQNAFAIPDDKMIFFGLRGCLPINPNDHAEAASRDLRVVEVDSTHPRCTIGQWKPGDEKLAVFPGSTTPHKNFTAQGPNSANQIFTGLHDYKTGVHMPASHARWPSFTSPGPNSTDGIPAAPSIAASVQNVIPTIDARHPAAVAAPARSAGS